MAINLTIQIMTTIDHYKWRQLDEKQIKINKKEKKMR